MTHKPDDHLEAWKQKQREEQRLELIRRHQQEKDKRLQDSIARLTHSILSKK